MVYDATMNETATRRTSIALSRGTADRINSLRIVPGELQESVINRALDCLQQEREQREDTRQDRRAS